MNNKLIKLRAQSLLFIAALIWGTNFVAQKSAMDFLPPFAFNGMRCFIGAFTLFLISSFFKSKHARKFEDLIKGGLYCGIFLFIGLCLQQAGIVTSSAGKAGFISSLYIVLVPLFSLFLGSKLNKYIWIGVFCAIFGLYFLCVKDGFTISSGDFIILLSAIFFALHIICISKFANKTNPIKLSCLQFLFAGIFSFLLSFMTETFTKSSVLNSSFELLYAGIMSSAVAFTLQITGQKHVKPYIASLILSLESVFAVIAGFLILGETLSPKEILGCILMFIAVFAAQYQDKKNSV